MFRYFITTDQTADFPEKLFEENFRIIPMTYAIDGVVYDGVNTPFLSPREFYSLLSSGKNSSTSMVPVAEARAFFESIFAQGFDILHISFSSALSGCYEGYIQAAELAKRSYPDRKIFIVDSRCASAGEGLLVYYCLKKRREGASVDENAEYALSLRDHIGHAFTVNDMFQLYRGGRVTKGTAVVGTAINIKPVLTVNEEGKLIPVAKALGRKTAIRSLTDKMAAKGAGYDNDLILIGHGDCFDDAVRLRDLVNERFGMQNVIITDIGPVIGSHCGKGVLALFYLCSDKIPF